MYVIISNEPLREPLHQKARGIIHNNCNIMVYSSIDSFILNLYSEFSALYLHSRYMYVRICIQLVEQWICDTMNSFIARTNRTGVTDYLMWCSVIHKMLLQWTTLLIEHVRQIYLVKR